MWGEREERGPSGRVGIQQENFLFSVALPGFVMSILPPSQERGMSVCVTCNY